MGYRRTVLNWTIASIITIGRMTPLQAKGMPNIRIPAHRRESAWSRMILFNVPQQMCIRDRVTKEATCTEDGERTRTCSVCQEEQKETIVKTGHSFGEWVVTKEPTCVDEGERTRSCSACGEKETEVIPATGKHTYGDEWKSDEDGHWHECTVCGVHSEKENHTYEWVIDKKATETEAGVKHEECSVCPVSYTPLARSPVNAPSATRPRPE